MLKFTSVSGSVRAITDITLTVTIIRTDITDLITVRITGIVIIATIIGIPIITNTSLTGIATLAGSNLFRASLIFLSGNSREKSGRAEHYFPDFGEAAGLVTGPLPGSSSWNSFLNC